MSKSDLTISKTGYGDNMDVTVETRIDIDDLVGTLETSERGNDIGERLLSGQTESIKELALELKNSDMERLVCDLLDSLPDGVSEAIASDYCGVCQERADLREAVEEIEGEQSGN